MAIGKNDPRKTRLAAALKENLKRRKAQERTKTGPKTLGTGPQAGLDQPPEPGPKSAPKPAPKPD